MFCRTLGRELGWVRKRVTPVASLICDEVRNLAPEAAARYHTITLSIPDRRLGCVASGTSRSGQADGMAGFSPRAISAVPLATKCHQSSRLVAARGHRV